MIRRSRQFSLSSGEDRCDWGPGCKLMAIACRQSTKTQRIYIHNSPRFPRLEVYFAGSENGKLSVAGVVAQFDVREALACRIPTTN